MCTQTTGWGSAVAFVLALLLVGSCGQLALAANVTKLPKETLEWCVPFFGDGGLGMLRRMCILRRELTGTDCLLLRANQPPQKRGSYHSLAQQHTLVD
eukprot:377895-Pelagomonas_calceolata.AAC.9